MSQDGLRPWFPTHYGGAVDGNLAHSSAGGTRHPVHGVQRLADVDVEVRAGVRGVVLALIVRFVPPGAVDEGGQVDDGAAVPHRTFRLSRRKHASLVCAIRVPDHQVTHDNIS